MSVAILPRSLVCLTISYVIDDADVIEYYLTEHSEDIECCIPIAVRDMFNDFIQNQDRSFPYEDTDLPLMKILSAETLVKYLSLLWNNDVSNINKLTRAIAQRLLYIIPYVSSRLHSGDENLYVSSRLHSGDENLHLIPLISRDATINDAFIRAANCGDNELIKILLACGADIHARPNVPEEEIDDAALLDATYKGHISTVKLLLDRKADVNTYHEHPLMAAIDSGHVNVAKLLLEYKANIHEDSELALDTALLRGNQAMIKLLLDSGADRSAMVRRFGRFV